MQLNFERRNPSTISHASSVNFSAPPGHFLRLSPHFNPQHQWFSTPLHRKQQQQRLQQQHHPLGLCLPFRPIRRGRRGALAPGNRGACGQERGRVGGAAARGEPEAPGAPGTRGALRRLSWRSATVPWKAEREENSPYLRRVPSDP